MIHFLLHLRVFGNDINLVEVNCDNQVAISYIKDFEYQGKTKHIDIKYNFVKAWLHIRKGT